MKWNMVFAMMMVLEGIARFVLELLRVEPPVVYVHGYGLSLSMVLGIGLAVFGAGRGCMCVHGRKLACGFQPFHYSRGNRIGVWTSASSS